MCLIDSQSLLAIDWQKVGAMIDALARKRAGPSIQKSTVWGYVNEYEQGFRDRINHIEGQCQKGLHEVSFCHFMEARYEIHQIVSFAGV